MYSQPVRRLFYDFVDSLVGNFVITKTHGSPNTALELTYIRNIQMIKGSYTFQHLLVTEKEVELAADVVQYYLTQDDEVERLELDSVTLNMDSAHIIPISNESVVSLLVDNSKLIREAAKEWYDGTIDEYPLEARFC